MRSAADDDLSTDFNPIVKLANETGTPLHLWEGDTIIIDENGNVVDLDHSNQALRFVWKILEKAIEFSRTKTDELDPSASLHDFFVEECDRMISNGEMSSEEKHLVVGMAQMWGAYVGDRVKRQSLKFFFLEDCIHGGT